MRQNIVVPRELKNGDVDAYFRLTGDLDDVEIEEAMSLLSPPERERAARFVFARDRRDYAAAHALLRTSLSRYAPIEPHAWQFAEANGGKPYVCRASEAPRLSINLSHTPGLVACAIAGGADVGIDVEATDRKVDPRVAQRFFSSDENRALLRCPSEARRADRFFALWTLKEAYVKATGQGLAHPLHTMVFTVADDDTVTFRPPPDVDATEWGFWLFAPTGGHRLAVAIRATGGRGSMTLSPAI